MAIRINSRITAKKLLPKVERVFELSASKILSLEKSWDPFQGTPVFTLKGRYTSRGWTEWTQGFQFGSSLLQFDATGEAPFLELGRSQTRQFMASHVSHTGVHDHGFNNISTYGNLLRLMKEGKIPHNAAEQDFYELALKVSGATQAARWTGTHDGRGYIYSFTGPHSLFIDTMRSLRSLAVAHLLGHVLMGERDQRISLLQRLIDHAATTARHCVFYDEGRDAYDVAGRVAHEAIFNVNDGHFRCPNSQQGYSPFSTWTRGLAWAICGFAEELEFLHAIADAGLKSFNGGKTIQDTMLKAAMAASDFYIQNTPTCGIPIWDTGAPNLHRMKDYLSKPSDPFNAWEPVDSSAASIAAQGMIRLGNVLLGHGWKEKGTRYCQAGYTIANTLFGEPYLSTDPRHQGLILHSVYHRPNGWDYIAKGQKVPNGESSMWGDYHARELALMLLREAKGEKYLTFYEEALPTDA
jgi:hypothetical protein